MGAGWAGNRGGDSGRGSPGLHTGYGATAAEDRGRVELRWHSPSADSEFGISSVRGGGAPAAPAEDWLRAGEGPVAPIRQRALHQKPDRLGTVL